MLVIIITFDGYEFYDVPRVLITDASSFQALAAILDYVTHLASMACWYQSDVR